MLKEADRQKEREEKSAQPAQGKKPTETKKLDDELQTEMKDIVKALIDYYSHGNEFSLPRFKNFRLPKG